jgi:hypothetical protein
MEATNINTKYSLHSPFVPTTTKREWREYILESLINLTWSIWTTNVHVGWHHRPYSYGGPPVIHAIPGCWAVAYMGQPNISTCDSHMRHHFDRR